MMHAFSRSIVGLHSTKWPLISMRGNPAFVLYLWSNMLCYDNLGIRKRNKSPCRGSKLPSAKYQLSQERPQLKAVMQVTLHGLLIADVTLLISHRTIANIHRIGHSRLPLNFCRNRDSSQTMKQPLATKSDDETHPKLIPESFKKSMCLVLLAIS